jgi:UDP-GlcNAc3NAcA epimerase
METLAVPPNIELVDPVGYGSMLSLVKGAQAVFTDSGGVQKEAYWMGVPCVTLRRETEWVETLAGGWNVLVDDHPELISSAIRTPTSDRDLMFGRGEGPPSRTIIEQLRAVPVS